MHSHTHSHTNKDMCMVQWVALFIYIYRERERAPREGDAPPPQRLSARGKYATTSKVKHEREMRHHLKG